MVREKIFVRNIYNKGLIFRIFFFKKFVKINVKKIYNLIFLKWVKIINRKFIDKKNNG